MKFLSSSLATTVAALAIAGCQSAAPSDPISGRPGAAEPQTMRSEPMATVSGLSPAYPWPDTGATAASMPAEHGPYPAPNRAATAEALPAMLAAALRTCDRDALARVTASRFSMRLVPEGGVDVVSTYGLSHFISNTLCQPSDEPVVFTDPPSSLRPVTATLHGAYDPALNVAGILFAAGRGADRRAEARLVLLRSADGNVRLGAVEYAEAGFDTPAAKDDDGHRTVGIPLNNGQSVEFDVPVAWHSDRSGGPATITSYLPYAYALSQDGITEGFEPGQTKLEFFLPEGDRSASIDEKIHDSTSDGLPPTEIQQEQFTLPGGETAVLARLTFSSGLSTQLYIATDDGVVDVACDGDPAPCEAIMRTARIR